LLKKKQHQYKEIWTLIPLGKEVKLEALGNPGISMWNINNKEAKMLTKLSRNNEKGFTLIELMIVIAIIGILAAIAIPQFTNYKRRAANSASMSDLKNMATAQEVYHTDNNTYTSTVANLSDAGYKGASKNVTVAITGANSTTFSATASHAGGTKTYTVSGPGGSITPNSPSV
jgi:prepilin-type N-terminal cleavage/methylation domain-containing protein